MTTPTPKMLTQDHARELADDLIRALTPACGDADSVNAVMTHWLQVLDVRDLSLVCIAAVQNVFTDCLTLTPLDQIPADRLALIPNLPNERKLP